MSRERPENYGQLSDALLAHVAEFIAKQPPTPGAILGSNLPGLHVRAIGSKTTGWCELSDKLCATVKAFIEETEGHK